jgi:hypothetical protein
VTRSKPFSTLECGLNAKQTAKNTAARGEAMIIEYDFGKKERPGGKRFNKPLGGGAQHGAKVLANPLPFVDRPNGRAAQLEKALRDAHAAHSSFAGGPAEPAEKILVDKAEYARLLRCKEIIEAALAQL